MYGTKLKTLNKDENLTEWQKDQKKKNYYNPSFFLKQETKLDPWEIGRRETQKVKNEIPVLSDLKFGFSARHRNNKEVNNLIRNQKMIKQLNLMTSSPP